MRILPILSLLNPENECAYQALGCAEICEFSRGDADVWTSILKKAYGERGDSPDPAEMKFPTEFYCELFKVDDYYLPPPAEDPKRGFSEVADVNRVLRMMRRTREIVASSP